MKPLRWGAYSAVLASLLLLASSLGCKQADTITRDTTYSNAQSPYKAEVTVQTEEESDTTTSKLSNGRILKHVHKEESCIFQRVTLRAKNKLHGRRDPFQYVRAKDSDCQRPASVDWEWTRLRGAEDQQRWKQGGNERRIAHMWLVNYLVEMYMDYPILRNIEK